MILTLPELYEGKATIIKDKSYLSTKEYVEPFIKLMSPLTDDFRIKVKLPDQITKGDTKDLTYNRVLIEAVLPGENTVDNHDEVIGFLYGLDIKKPVAKLYRSYLNRACTNMSVFNPSWINVQEVQAETSLSYNVKELLESPNDFPTRLKKMKSEFIDREDIYNSLGKWVDYCLRGSYDNEFQTIKLSPQLPIKAYESLFINKDSKYFIRETEAISVFDVHEAMTQIITDDKKDLLTAFEKTIMVNIMMGLN